MTATAEDTTIHILSVHSDRETASALVRVIVPKFKLVATCEGDADGAVLDMGIAHGLTLDSDLLGLLDDGERDGNTSGYIERTEDGWQLWIRDGSEWAEGEVELYADKGRATVNRQHPYGTCGTPLDGWCADSLTAALARAHGRGSDDMTEILGGIVTAIDRAARG